MCPPALPAGGRDWPTAHPEPAPVPDHAMDDVTYVLERVRGQALPAPEATIAGRAFLTLEGTLTLHADGTYTEARTIRVVDRGPRGVDPPRVEREARRQTTGRWAAVAGPDGPAVEFTPDPRPLPPNTADLSLGHKPLFHVGDGGRVLQGLGWHRFAEYVYGRATP